MVITMIYIQALLSIAGMLIVGLSSIYWYTGTEEYQNKTEEEKAKFWFG